jgi:NAD(P)-dependent dehydrogenase (short-subunit alcohol dehydrogenase family)
MMTAMASEPGEAPRLLEDMTAVVTGGGAGIGAAIARRFVAHGATVEVGEIDTQRLASLADEPAITATEVDVRDALAVEEWRSAVAARRDGIDVLVNNVGHYVQSVPFRFAEPDHWDELHEMNLRHLFVVTRAFLPLLFTGRDSSIINVHSVEALRGYPPDPVYAAYKAAAAHFTTSLAGELGRKGIRVNGIAPDITQTPQVDYRATTEPQADPLWEAWAPIGRVGQPEDQADVAVFLASNLSRFVTGLNLPVDGGTHAYGGWFWSPALRRFTNRPPNL